MIGQRRRISGLVVSDKMDKTVVVRVERRFKHATFKKYMTRYKKYMAHDEQNQCGIGDTVALLEIAPKSKNKRWKVLEIVEKAR